ncbi:hypothetical protein H5410_046510 [Solanum commersonii]|uniref:Uncharacterized protein n=1 Tax=Solanum commersonii TaxID=4109 RepID=A0A9J5XFQ3_SOLCO|nr:hypothetical protein H5410_046510 [Solanum commersonii]
MLSQDLVKSSLEDIVSDEIQKFKHSYQSETFDNSKFSLALDDAIWKYDGIHEAYQEQVSNETWEDEEDEYLARAVYKHMNLNEKAGKEVWCPIFKQAELKEDCHHIYCSPCGLRLNRDDEVSVFEFPCLAYFSEFLNFFVIFVVNLEVLRNRLDEAHSDHLDQGCKLKSKFCVETRFDLTALYITSQGCSMFEVVM